MVDSLLYLYILIIMLYFDVFMNELVDYLKEQWNNLVLCSDEWNSHEWEKV